MPTTNLNIHAIQKAGKVLRSLAHPVRLKLIQALALDKRSVLELARELGLPQAVISKHLGVLKKAGVVESRAVRNFRYYHIKHPEVLKILACISKTCSKGGPA